MAKRRRKHRKNGATPKWVVPAIVVSGLVSVWLWKQANPTASLNPMPSGPPPA